MLCPRCNSVNKDTAKVCRECGLRLAGLRITPEARKKEKKYLAVGLLAFIAIVIALVLFINALSCIAGSSGCAACSGCGGKETVNENVEGDWSAEIVSEADVTPTDVVEEPVLEEPEVTE